MNIQNVRAKGDHHKAGDIDGLTASNSLTDLAARIQQEHDAVADALKRGVEHAMRAGDLLIEAKAQLNKHGQWLPWLREHCLISERTASLYMRLARHRSELQAKSATVADLTLNDAIALLRPPKEDPNRDRWNGARLNWTARSMIGILQRGTIGSEPS